MAAQKFATDYIDVAARIVMFREQYPEGSLQPADLTHPYVVETIGAETYIAVVAAAYRTPDDPRPGVGMAYEVFPGKTNFTRGSELQNAETSAWGRAIVAALAADTKHGIASAEEVRNRTAEREPEHAAPRPEPVREQSPADKARTALLALLSEKGVPPVQAVMKYREMFDGELKDSDDPEKITAVADTYREVAA